LEPTNVKDPEYFHKVVDCQYACPAHTPVPEYIRLIAQEKYAEAYMVNWESNVFPGILAAPAIDLVNQPAAAEDWKTKNL
jgi:formate dehydrogenase beta subunit